MRPLALQILSLTITIPGTLIQNRIELTFIREKLLTISQSPLMAY